MNGMPLEDTTTI